jgi:hypothetical protein
LRSRRPRSIPAKPQAGSNVWSRFPTHEDRPMTFAAKHTSAQA